MGEESPKPASTPTGAVFLSYASQDAEAAQRICAVLRSAGVEVWFDQSELRGGDAWDHKIRDQIHDCRLFIPVISANTEHRDEGYFRREWRLAVERVGDMTHKRTFLVPVVIDETPQRGASVPEKFHELQWTRLPGGETPPAFVERIKRLLIPDGSPAVTVTAVGSASTSVTARPLRRSFLTTVAIWGLGAIAVVAVAYFVGDKLWPSKHPAPSAAIPSTPTSAGSQAVAVPEKSIAVLPFVDLSEKHDQAYFGDGLTEELINLLTKVPTLQVVARTSSFHFKGTSASVADIGKALHVAYVLEGSVREAEDRFRITVQLIRTDNERHVWSETYDRVKSDVFKVQDEIAGQVIQGLRLALADASRVRSSETSWEVYRTYLEGQLAWNASGAALEKAVAAYRAALSVDPSFAPAWASLSLALGARSDEIGEDPTRSYTEARHAALRALQLDPNLVKGHVAMAFVYMHYDWDWNAATQEAEAAERLESGNTPALGAVSEVAAILGDWARAIEVGRRMVARDPLSLYAHTSLAYPLSCIGPFEESAAEYQRELELDPSVVLVTALLARDLMLQGRLQEALQIARREPSDSFRYWAVAIIQHAMGRDAESSEALAELKHRFPGGDDTIAWVYAVQGKLDEAFAWFEKAFEHRNRGLAFLKCMPEAPAFTRDPRYRALLKKMKLPES